MNLINTHDSEYGVPQSAIWGPVKEKINKLNWIIYGDSINSHNAV